MTGWAAATERLNQGVAAIFGAEAIVRVGPTETIVRGVFSNPSEDQAMGVMDFREPSPTIDFITAEFAATGAKARDTVVVDGIDYTITAEPEPDAGGMTRCSLRRYG